MKDPAQTQLLSHSEYQVCGMKEVYAHTPIICPNRWGWESISSAAGMSFQIDKGQIDGRAFLSSKSEQNTFFFFFPSTSKKRLWKESCAWAITFPRSVLWPSINCQPHRGDSLHITSAISFHCDAAQVLYVTAGLMHNSLAATCDTQAAMCVPCEEALKVRDSLIHEHSCNCTTQKCKETDKTWAILLYEVLHGSSLNAA